MHQSVRPHLSQLAGFALALAFFYPLSERTATSFTRFADHSRDISLPAECNATGHERLWSLSVCLSFSLSPTLCNETGSSAVFGASAASETGKIFP